MKAFTINDSTLSFKPTPNPIKEIESLYSFSWFYLLLCLENPIKEIESEVKQAVERYEHELNPIKEIESVAGSGGNHPPFRENPIKEIERLELTLCHKAFF